ncbi:hypothetical protein X798_06821 [Onchocerca flexuosa]|uniref:Uncharacterized protein n=1 Tax=Onchocerca flexuosa TaxID=387005 RepID=A0A238BMD6_9BILA|nr:hypothetical protein X798_06821 [Onchocerca flexuosa]
MYVPCNALDVIMSDHGKNWLQPLHSSKYIWNESPLNMIEIGTIPSNEKTEYFVEYDSVKKENTVENNSISPAKYVTSQNAGNHKTLNFSKQSMNITKSGSS